jgi:uncharacterized protein with HEPN domain
MNPKAARLPDFLSHILQAIHRIQRYTRGRSREAFLADEQLQDAIVRNIEIIGEAARNIATHSPNFVERHTDIPWAALYAMRNRVAHGYWTVDLDVVWNVVQRDLPILETQIRAFDAARDELVGDPPP